MGNFFRSIYYGIVYFVAGIIWRRRKIVYEGGQLDTDKPSVYCSNHAGILGPVIMCRYFKIKKKIWITGEMVKKESGANYFFHEMLSGRAAKNPKKFRKSAKMMFNLIYPMLYKNKRFIVVHKTDKRIIETFKETVSALEAGYNVVIFPEKRKKYGEFVTTLQYGFTKLGEYYYKKTGKSLDFYPTYIPNGLKTINIGKPITYDGNNNSSEERKKVYDYLQVNIERIGSSVPKHKVIPYKDEAFYEYYPEFVDDELAFAEFLSVPYSE